MQSGGLATNRLTLRGFSSKSTKSSRLRQRGATIVEFVIAFSMVMFLMLAIIEMGYAFFQRSAVSRMAHTGARMAGVQGKNAQADYEILKTIANDTTINLNRVSYVVIYRATSTLPDFASMNAAHPGCTSGSVNDWCNRYTGSTLLPANLNPANFGCLNGATQLSDYAFCPYKVGPSNGRADVVGRDVSNNPIYPDTIGVYVVYNNNAITGLRVGGSTFTEDDQAKVEPTAYK